MDADPLVKMAIIYHQFESIHPFYDAKGRTGCIIKHKKEYYRLLQSVREAGDWETWILIILEGVEQTASETVVLIASVKKLML